LVCDGIVTARILVWGGCLPGVNTMIYDFEYDAQGVDDEREEAHP
jgi:hypothetical protein